MSAAYVLMTAAKNEDRYIATTIEAVLRQTVRPLAWFIVDDGSTDETARIVERHAKDHPFIHLHATCGGARSFGAQYRAINAAFARAAALSFDYVGTLDADIAPRDDDYFERVLARMEAEPRLGVAGGYVHERTRQGTWKGRSANSPDSVAGGVQMFRRACYEQIGGYTPLLFGGEDWLAQLDARIAGWQVSAMPGLPVHHCRPTSSAGGRWRGLFRLGLLDASFGSHALFEALKCARRIGEHPKILGGVIRFAGFCWWRLVRGEPLLPRAKVDYLRRQQLRKMANRLGLGRLTND